MSKEIFVKGKIGGWRPNSGRKPGFIGYWNGKKRPNMIGNKYKTPLYGDDNPMRKKEIRVKFRDENHPRWKGGGWMYWRKKALVRDNYTCKVCGLFDPEVMQVDHIEPIKSCLDNFGHIKYDSVVHELNNLQTLCANCHARKTYKSRKERRKGKSFYSI